MAAGGFKMSLGGLKAKPGLKAVANKNSAPKPKKALLGDDEPEDTNGLQEIAGFDAASGGAIDAHAPAEKKGPLVIPSLPNRNWRDEARKKQLERAPHTQQAQNGDVVMDEPEKEVVYGLTVPTAPTTDTPSNGAEEAADQTAMDIDNAPQDDLTDAQRLEKQALESLLTGKSTDTARVVPAITDEEALANDLADAPDAPDVATYEATPIEGFGLAMLRGMGWKDSDGEGGGRRKNNGGKAPAEVKRRPALLGIGAKEDTAKDVELGEFNSKARPKKGQRGAGEAPQGYNPVSLRNKKTGEIITEEELKRKMENQEMVQEEAARSERRSERSDRERGERDGRSSRDDRRDRRSDNDRRSDRDSHRDRDRDRRSSRDRGSRRDYDRRDDRRESDRRDSDRRDPDRRDNKRRHRSRSRSPRDDKRRERYRSRSRSRDRDDEERRRRRRERERRDRDRDRSRDRD